MLRRAENFVVQPGSLFRRRAWELAGPLDEDSHYLFDFEFALRVARHGQVRPIPDRLALYRVHPESKSGGGSLLKARDYARFADRMGDEREGRARALLAAGDYFYDARELAAARHALVSSLRLRPSRRGAALLARTLARSVVP
jgi:GT2 family glycosyltransferase